MVAKLQKRAKLLQEIEAKQEELDKVQAELDELQAMDPVEGLATELHDMLCTWNHVDGCSWEYTHGKPDKWTKCETHKRWLAKAEKLHAAMERLNISVEDFFELMTIAKSY